MDKKREGKTKLRRRDYRPVITQYEIKCSYMYIS